MGRVKKLNTIRMITKLVLLHMADIHGYYRVSIGECMQVLGEFFFFIGCTPPDQDCKYAPSNHSPRFYVDENGLKVGVRALTTLALEWLARPHAKA